MGPAHLDKGWPPGLGISRDPLSGEGGHRGESPRHPPWYHSKCGVVNKQV